MALAVGDLIQVSIECQGPLDGSLNIRHYRVDSVAGAGPTPAEAALGFFDALRVAYAPLMATTTTFRQVAVQQILPLPRKRIGYANQVPVTGTGGAQLLPKQVCGMVLLETPLSGNANTGKVFVPYPSEDDNDATGVPNAAYDLLLVDLGILMSGQLTVGPATGNATCTPVVFHRESLTASAITGYSIGSKWHTQRRRQNNRFKFF